LIFIFVLFIEDLITKGLREKVMIAGVQERITILENSIKILEEILRNLGQNNVLIQNRIKSYKKELQIRKDYPN
jgi:predicted patatin/cPLA2 family phospholipase